MPTTPANTEQVVAAAQAFVFTAYRLKPLTKHNFYFANSIHNADCTPYGGVKGGDIITDASGNVSFTYYYNSGLPTTATSYTDYNSALNSVVGNKVALIASADNTSTASVTITISNANTIQYYQA